MTTPVVKLGNAVELASAVPMLLGFRPVDRDLVLVTMAGKRVGLSLRVTAPEMAPEVTALARHLAATVRQGHPDVTAVHVVLHSSLTGEAATWGQELAREGLLLGDVMRVDAGVVYCEGCCISQEVGRVDYDTSPVAAAGVAAGQVVASSRDELAARIAWSGRDTAGAPDNQVVASLRWALRDVAARDAYMSQLASQEPDRLALSREQLCLTARHTRPGGARDTVLTVAAVASYLMGDGGFARVCLEAATGDLSLASLVDRALDAAMPPEVLRSMLIAAS